MKKLIISLCVLTLLISQYGYCNDFNYDEFLEKSSEYSIDEFDIKNDTTNNTNALKKLYDLLLNTAKSEFGSMIKTSLEILLVLITMSMISIFVINETMAEFCRYGACVICGVIFINIYNDVSELCVTAVTDICDYMNLSFPSFAMLIASSGYMGTANTLQGVFLIVSNIIGLVAKNLIIPMLYVSALMMISNFIINSGTISGICDFINKTVKYILGIFVTIFGAVMGFSGISSSIADGIGIKTAKYAVSNFVPIVGACLSDALSTVVSTSVLLKNTVGYIALFVVMMICFVPIVKIYIVSFFIKMLSLSSGLINQNTFATLIDSLYNTIVILNSILLLITIIFIIVIGMIVSIGG